MTREFYDERRPELLPEQSRIAASDFQKFLKSTRQRVDTGIGYGYTLWKAKEKWLPLRRSNKWNPHFLMAGVYGDIFFHLGSSSRRPAFNLDYKSRLSLRLSERLRHMPLAWRFAEIIEHRYLKENERIFQTIASGLRRAPESFLSALRRMPN